MPPRGFGVGRRYLPACALSFVCIGLAPESGGAATSPVIVLENATVVTMNEDLAVLPHHTVVIRGDRIESIHPSSDDVIPEEGLVIDASGKYVLPGFVDAHVHVGSRQELLSHLRYGVTTVFDLDGTGELLRWRQEIASNRLPGPDLYVAGPALGARFHANGEGSDEDLYPDEVRDRVRSFHRDGFDFIKVYTYLHDDAFEAAMDEAKRLSMPVFGHIPRDSGLRRSLKLGLDVVAHAEEIYYNEPFNSEPDGSRIPSMVRMFDGSPATLIPNLVFIESVIHQLEDIGGVIGNPEFKYLSSFRRISWRPTYNKFLHKGDLEEFLRKMVSMLAILKGITVALHDAGVPLLIGTDASNCGAFPGHSWHREMAILEEIGIPREDILVAATRNAGDFLRRHIASAPPIGRIQEGYSSNLVVLQDNPLEVIANTLSIVGVVKGDHWYTREALDELRDEALPAQNELLLKAEQQADQGLWEQAYASYEQAANNGTMQAIDWWSLGNAASKLGKHLDAAQAYEHAMGNVFLWENAGTGALFRYVQANRLDSALDVLERLVARGYQDTDTLRNDPALQPLRNLERFQNILRSIEAARHGGP